MNPWLILVLYGTSFTLLFAFGGFVFGGLARGMAQWSQRSPEKTLRDAFVVGGAKGAIFSGAIGLVTGLFGGYFLKLDLASVEIIVGLFLLLGFMAILAIVLGTIGYFVQWHRQSEEEKAQASLTPRDAIQELSPHPESFHRR